MKKFLLIGLAAGWLGIAGAQEQRDVVDGVVAIVNDRVITYSDVQMILQPLLPDLRSSYSGQALIEQIRKVQKDALNTLIDRALIINEFNSKGYQLPENAVDQQLKDDIERNFGGNRASLIKSLEAEHITLTQYREQLRDRIIVQAMTNRKQFHDYIMSPYKIEQYYNEHQDDFKVEDRVKLRMMLIKKDKSPDADSAARRRLAEEILSKLDAGDSFESLAKTYSEGRDAKSGGEWGWVTRRELRKELNEVAFTLKPGQHSQLIETPAEGNDPGGYYILRVEDFRAAHVKPLTEARDEIEKNLRQQQRARLQDDWIKQLREKAYIRTF